MICACRSKITTIWTECNCAYIPLMRHARFKLTLDSGLLTFPLIVNTFPQQGSAVLRGGGDITSIGTGGDCIDWAIVIETSKAEFARHLPYSCSLVTTCSNKIVTIWAKCESLDTEPASQTGYLTAIMRFPYSCSAISTGGCKIASIGAERESMDFISIEIETLMGKTL